MFRFNREQILPLFLQRRITVAELARLSGISHKAAYRAVNGLTITAPVVEKTARALNFDALTFLANPAQIKEVIQ